MATYEVKVLISYVRRVNIFLTPLSDSITDAWQRLSTRRIFSSIIILQSIHRRLFVVEIVDGD